MAKQCVIVRPGYEDSASIFGLYQSRKWLFGIPAGITTPVLAASLLLAIWTSQTGIMLLIIVMCILSVTGMGYYLFVRVPRRYKQALADKMFIVIEDDDTRAIVEAAQENICKLHQRLDAALYEHLVTTANLPPNERRTAGKLLVAKIASLRPMFFAQHTPLRQRSDQE